MYPGKLHCACVSGIAAQLQEPLVHRRSSTQGDGQISQQPAPDFRQHEAPQQAARNAVRLSAAREDLHALRRLISSAVCASLFAIKGSYFATTTALTYSLLICTVVRLPTLIDGRLATSIIVHLLIIFLHVLSQSCSQK